ncbi:MAG TPA: response regulator [Steroidobacteraceae bacterium]|nr:response regulator [Steroidobacteraceae bacterium]
MNASERVNILLVDDQQSKLLSHEAVLEEIGENLLKASSARQAFEYLLKHEIALVLIDVCMPDLNGFELAGMIREHPRFRTTAIIFVSAIMLTYPDQLRGYQLGGVDYVPVPVVPELLRAKVKVFLDLYRKTRALERFNAELETRVAERTSELQRFNEQLEERIKERTRERETALAQLFEAQKMDTIGQLTGGVAHDFNNLLMAVLGSLTLLEKRLPDDPRSHRLLQNAVQGAQRGAALTQRLLAFSRRQELKPEAVDVPQLVDGMRELLERALGPGIEFQAQFQAALPAALVDANQLELALLNVALNARDAMPTGGTLTISATHEHQKAAAAETALQPGEYVRILIADDGVGMDEVTLAKATEPFFTTKGPGKGTGLGLSMVHGLAAQSGGLLRIDSQPKLGTTLELWLPMATTAVPAAVDAPSPTAAPPIGQCKVLLVDDDLLVMTGISAMLEDLGHTPIEAHSGAEALGKLAAGVEVDVVITDHAMPGMTGLQLARSIQEKYSGLPIILATGYAELPADPQSLGIQRLPKPCNQYEIAMAIQSALGVRQPVRRRRAAAAD